MLQRVITGIILLAVIIPLLLLSHTVVFPIVVSLLSLVGVYEMLKCLGVHKNIAIALPSFILAVGTPVCARTLNDTKSFAPWALAAIVLYIFWLNAYAVITKGKTEYTKCASVLMSVIYITVGFSSLIFLRDSEGGKFVFLLVFIGAWITDTMAYFTGFLFGKHKLIPEISPKKTVEGAIGGTLFSGIAFSVYGFIISEITNTKMSLVVLFVAGLVAAVVAQLGDLIASLIKREAGIKDYGNIFPGHGGILDRFDSIIALAPIILIMHGTPFINFII